MFQKLFEPFKYRFSVNSDGLYSISIFAVCKKKNYLRVEIDGVALKGILPKSRNEFFNIPSSWNGNELKNIAKTVIFVTKLSKGSHNLNFISRGQAEIVLEPTITKLNNSGLITVLKDIQSEERNCQPWITVALIDLPISVLDISVSCQKRFLDSDDVKLIINEKVQKNTKSILRGKNWFWRGWQLKGKTQISRFDLNFSSGVHFIELWGDERPVLKNLDILINGDVPIKRIPTAQNPEWTGNFLDDPEEIILARLIFGEANGQSLEAKEWVGWSVVNRSKANSWWPNTVHGVILQAGQYDAFKESDKNFFKIINPLDYENIGELDKKSWFECCEVANNIIFGKINDLTEATHFHSFVDQSDIKRFEKNIVPKGKFLKKIGRLYFYWSPN